MNKSIITITIIVLGLISFFAFRQSYSKENAPLQNVKISFKNATYIIDGKPVTLVNGLAETEVAPGSASKVSTKYFGNEVSGDFDSDGRIDTAFILTQNTGGSGTFYFLVAGLNKETGIVGTSAVLLGDRIAPQTTEMKNGNIVVVNYAERKPGESFATVPSVGKSIWLLLDTKTMQFGEVVQNFEGEADPNVMSFDMKKWSWINTIYSDGKTVTPKMPEKFVITFTNPNRFSASTDCNGVGGEYKVMGEKITFTKMMSTLMYCQGSQEQDFGKMIGEVESFHFTSKGELVFSLKNGSGAMYFK